MIGNQWWEAWPVVILLSALILAISAALGAFFIKQSCRMALGFSPPNRMAVKAVIAGALASTPFGIAASFHLSLLWFVVLVVATFIVYSGVVGRLIESPDSGPIGIGNGALVTLIWSGMYIVTSVFVGFSAAFVIPIVADDTRSRGFRPIEASATVSGTVPPEKMDVSDADNSQKPIPDSMINEQDLLNAAAEEVMRKYPMLNFQSPQKNQKAIDEVVLQRDALIGAGVSPHEALRRAADIVVDRIATKSNIQRSSSTNSRESTQRAK